MTIAKLWWMFLLNHSELFFFGVKLSFKSKSKKKVGARNDVCSILYIFFQILFMYLEK